VGVGFAESTGTRSARVTLWRAVAAVEVALAAAAIIFDLFLPTLVILAIAGLSLAYHRQGPSSLGFLRVPRPWRMAGEVLVWVMAWTALLLILIIPVVERITGQQQDMSTFGDLEGNLPQLLLLLALSWTLAALGEETAYRGFVLTRAREAIGTGRPALALAIALSAVLFGLAHTEQGVVGVVLTTLDAVFFSLLRLHTGSLWASVLAHGLNNTIGLTAFYLVGPIYGLW
jgi:membrane protease YdiL (CAAX protease family)